MQNKKPGIKAILNEIQMAKSVDDMVINKRVNIKRYKEIISVFAKHGFGLLFDH